jgi:hypothetical protein
MSREWDMTSTHSLESAAEWIRSKSDALVVMVVSRTAYALAVHADLAPSDGAELVRDLLPAMIEDTNSARKARREAEVRRRAREIAANINKGA